MDPKQILNRFEAANWHKMTTATELLIFVASLGLTPDDIRGITKAEIVASINAFLANCRFAVRNNWSPTPKSPPAATQDKSPEPVPPMAALDDTVAPPMDKPRADDIRVIHDVPDDTPPPPVNYIPPPPARVATLPVPGYTRHDGPDLPQTFYKLGGTDEPVYKLFHNIGAQETSLFAPTPCSRPNVADLVPATHSRDNPPPLQLFTDSLSLRVSAIASTLLDRGMTNILQRLSELHVIAPASSVGVYSDDVLIFNKTRRVVYIDNVLIFNDDSPGAPSLDFRVLQPPYLQAWHKG
jgi:hypothetical protein